MIEYLKHLIKSYFKSYDNTEDGFSRRKILATVIITVICPLLSFKFANETNIIYMLIIWMLLSGLLLGFILFQQIVKLWSLRNGTVDKKEDSNVG